MVDFLKDKAALQPGQHRSHLSPGHRLSPISNLSLISTSVISIALRLCMRLAMSACNTNVATFHYGTTKSAGLASYNFKLNKA